MTRRPLSVAGAIALVAILYLWFAAIIVRFDDYRQRIERSGDNPFYAEASLAVRETQAGADVALRHFIGLPLLSAGIAETLRIDDVNAIASISIVAGAISIGLATALWGPVVAAWFALLNLDWIQRTMFGGAEPLFCCLIFGALYMLRRDRWIGAAILASLATIVRPFGVFLLLAMGVVSLARRDFRRLAGAVAVSAIIAAAYIAATRSIFGDPFGNIAWYRSMGLAHDRSFIPFVSWIGSYRDHLITAKNVVKTLAWTVFTAIAVIAAVVRRDLRAEWRSHPAEWLFGAIYLASFCFLPAWWIEGELPRYLVAVIPLLLVGVRKWIPDDWRAVALIGFASVTLAAIEDMPFFNAFVRRLGF